jgi:hypothetical protein
MQSSLPKRSGASDRRNYVSVAGLCTVLLVTTACLPEPVPIEGKQLFAGRDIENMSFLEVNGKKNVLFETRVSLPSAKAGGVVDMWIVPVDGSVPAKRFFSGRVEADSWSSLNLGGDVPQFWVAHNERTVSVAQRSVRLTDAVRVDVQGNILEQLRDVTQFSLLPRGVKTFRRPLANGKGLGYHLRGDDGVERILDDLTGPVMPNGSGFYYVGGPEFTFYWVPNFSAPAEPLRSGVTRNRFLSDSQAILTVPEEGKPVDVLFDLNRKTERKLPGARICCWLETSPKNRDVWRYAEARSGTAAAVYHEYNVKSGEHSSRPLPAPLVDLIRISPRPESDMSLLFDSAGNVATDDPMREPRVTPISLKAPSPRFSDDGRFLLYVKPTTVVPSPEGPLFIQDSDFAAPERQLSPVGTSLLISSFFTLEEPDPPVAVFWARFGNGASDLYFADLAGPAVTRVAESIRDVSVTRRRIIGIVRTSLQDLVGDLVIKNIADGSERIVGRSVDSYIMTDDRSANLIQMVYILRTRKDASVEGLWMSELPPS